MPMFTDVFPIDPARVDPRWLFCGVFTSPPNEKRNSWLYVSSGLSNAWEASLSELQGIHAKKEKAVSNSDDKKEDEEEDEEEEEAFSGLGCELVFETTEEAQWAVRRVQDMMVFQLLLTAGLLGDQPPLGLFDRIPLRSSIVPGAQSALRTMMIAPPSSFPAEFTLPSGKVELFALAGISEAEAAFGREHGADKLLALLTEARAFPVTDPARASLV